MLSKINVAYICNDAYMPMTGISILSLLENNKDAEEIIIYLAGDEIKQENMDKLIGLVEKYGRKLVVIDLSRICRKLEKRGIKKYKGQTYSPYLKNLLTEEMPSDTERLLYIDSDTIIAGSLSELFAKEMEMPIYMVADIMWDFYKKKLGMDNNSAYYNSGIILYNIPVWKRKKCHETYFEFLCGSQKQYVLGDQDITNILFSHMRKDENKIGILDLRFNYYSNYYLLNRKKLYLATNMPKVAFYSEEDIDKACKNVIVYHCSKYNGERPWESGNSHPFLEIFKYYKEISPWKDFEPFESRVSKEIKMQIRLEKLLPSFVYIPILRMAQRYYFYSNEKKINT